MKTSTRHSWWILLLAAVPLAAACARQNPAVPAEQQRGPQNQETAARKGQGGSGSGMAEAEKSLPPSLIFDLGRGVSMELLLIRPGTFLMGDDGGDDNAKPAHKVTISRPFYIGKYKVTQQQWQAVTGGNPSHFQGPTHPVDSVGWEDCQAFLRKLNEKFGGTSAKFSLPTEAQWEYACRAGSTARFCFGDDEARLGEYAWFYGNAEEKTRPVGEKKPNAWGLYDVHGNLFEWCADWYDRDYYKSSPASDPTGPAAGSLHVDRGGAWQSLARGCCCAYRNTNSPRPDYLIGLRIVCTR